MKKHQIEKLLGGYPLTHGMMFPELAPQTETEPLAGYAQVIIPPLSEGFLYGIPQSLGESVHIGSRIEVPFGKRTATGYVVELKENSDDAEFTIKPLSQLLVETPCFDSNTLAFYEWMSRYYCVPLGRVIETAIPEPVSPKREKQWFIADSTALEALKGKTQRAVFEFLLDASEKGASHTLLQKHFPRSSQVLKTLLQKEILRMNESEESPTQYLEPPLSSASSPSTMVLQEKQQKAVEQLQETLKEDNYSSFLLHGVTGSGKTEVYIEAALSALEAGGSIMVLVPEIALTPQLVDRFRARLPYPIAVLHSSLPKRKRWESWRALVNGECRVALGARSTIFAPMKNLSLIIVDEEHDSSYKQGDGFRYNARDLALVRGSLEKAVVVLGSATPSVDTFYNASIKKHGYLRLKHRPFENEKLQYEVVNLNKIRRKEMASTNVSPQLYEAIQETLIKQQQVFLLYNRRGFARYLQCRSCGEVVYCPNCSVPLTFHQQGNKLLCHYCSYSAAPSRYCGSCSHTNSLGENQSLLEQRGSGTQKILDELQELFPQASIARLDRDSADKLENLEEIIQQVRDKEIQILAGTQMIAKGHDLPGVTLVGIIDCDVGLHMPDFRASERVFQLLTQAGGRAGRREFPGKVIMQTRVPTHPSITMTTEENYHEFAKRELTLRKQLRYPPFAKLARIVSAAPEKDLPLHYLTSLRKIVVEWCTNNEVPVECLGPVTTPIEKVKAHFRGHLILRAESSSDIRKVVTVLKENIKPPKHIRLTYDIDPLDML